MNPQTPQTTQNPILLAILAAGLALVWVSLDVRYNYGGNWTGLFCIGEQTAAPLEGLYRFRNSPGYDGQFYLSVAHDPLARGMQQYVDNPPLRWRRILLPALAYVAALGNTRFIPFTYIAVVLACVFLGSWWLARHARDAARSAWWGLGFLALPAVAVSLDRMTVDVALAALCVAFAVVSTRSNAIFVVLALAPLARETGLALIVAYCVFELLQRNLKRALLGAAMALPWLAWALYLRVHLWADGTPWTSAVPLFGLVTRTLHPIPASGGNVWIAKAMALDFVAVLGMWAAFAVAVWFVCTRKTGLLELATIIFAAGLMFVAKPDVWADAYAFGRTMTPLLLFPALLALRRRSWPLAFPLALVVARITFQIYTVSKPILHGLYLR